jgi:cobalamin synthase
MGILLAQQSWPGLTELWLTRQIEGIAGDVVGFAAYEPTFGYLC